MDGSRIEGYYHLAIEACAQASQLEEDRPSEALTEYRRSLALIETMRQLFRGTLQETDEVYLVYFSGLDDVEGICKVRIAQLEGELPTSRIPGQSPRATRRKSSESLNTIARGGLSRSGIAPPRKPPERSRGAMRERVERQKLNRSPSPEKKEKKHAPHSLRPSVTTGPALTRVSSLDSATASCLPSQAAVEASRAAAFAWQTKKLPKGELESKRVRNPSPTSSRSESIDMNNFNQIGMQADTMSLLDAPLIDFSALAMSTSGPTIHDPLQSWAPLSPALTPPPQPQPEASSSSRRKQRRPQSRNSGGLNAAVNHPVKPSNTPPSSKYPRSASAPDLSEPLSQLRGFPISLSISEDVSVEQELSREEMVLKELKGVDEDLARTILNDIVVRGDEVQWDDIGLS
jgi:hypothetical protein